MHKYVIDTHLIIKINNNIAQQMYGNMTACERAIDYLFILELEYQTRIRYTNTMLEYFK